MIDYKQMRTIVNGGLSKYLGIPVIRGNQSVAAPAYPYMITNVTTIASENNGTWQEHEDGKDRKLVRSIWSVTSLSDDWDESVANAIKARDWIEHLGRSILAENGIMVQSTTAITNRDNVLTIEYERLNGFDVIFYVYDVLDNPSATYGTIDSADIAQERIE